MTVNERVTRSGVRAGYDLWSATYDATPNPLVALDRRYTMDLLAPQTGEMILDAACGTGQHLKTLTLVGSRPVGVDLSRAMLRVARRKLPRISLVQADLDRELPLHRNRFDAVLCALVGEHLTKLSVFFRETRAVLQRRGRLVFSVFHPELAAAGIESNFARGGVEYRLGAQRHSIDDYVNMMAECGFQDIRWQEFRGDGELVREVPWAVKYLHRPLLLIIQGWRAQ